MWLERASLIFLGHLAVAVSFSTRFAATGNWLAAEMDNKPAAALTAEDLGLHSLRPIEEDEETLDGA